MTRILTPFLHTVRDGGEVLGYLAVDSTVRGRSLGGLRIAPDVTAEEIAELARAMTLKYGLAGLPQGGAKAGVLGDPEASADERRERLAAFGRAIAGLLRSRVYQPDTDMGTRADDIRGMLSAAGAEASRRAFRTDRSGFYTALTVMAGAREALRRRGIGLKGATVAIEGFGAVGGALASVLNLAGARVIAVSTSRGAIHDAEGLDVPRLVALTAALGSRAVLEYREAEAIEAKDLTELQVDLLSPCARPWSIRESRAAGVRAKVISPGANAPITPAAEGILAERGVLVVPDFVANSGGVIGGTMAFAAVGERRIETFLVDRMGSWIDRLLERAERTGVTPREVATPLARARFEEVRRRAERPGPAGRAVGLAVELHRRGLLPRPLVGALAASWFERSLAPAPDQGGPL
ncbi:MAG: Glu/Leu/Phe/Val family dehydrogenase [Gemmatimonadota bacterium]